MNEFYAGEDLMIALIKNDLLHTQLIKRIKTADDRFKDYEPQMDEILINFLFLYDNADRSVILQRYRDFKAEMPIISYQNRLEQLQKMATGIYFDLVS